MTADHHKKKNHTNLSDTGGQKAEGISSPSSSLPSDQIGNVPKFSSAARGDEKIEILKQEYDDLKKKIQEIEGLREKFLRAAADFENAKKRNAREREEFIKFSQERILRDLLPVLDNFERAIGHATDAASATENGTETLQQNFKTLASGVQLVQKQLFDILKRNGLKRVETVGQKFDPHFHEVVGHVAQEGPEDHIVDELESGYTLHDRLLRAAKVRIRMAPKQTNPSDVKQDEIT